MRKTGSVTIFTPSMRITVLAWPLYVIEVRELTEPIVFPPAGLG